MSTPRCHSGRDVVLYQKPHCRVFMIQMPSSRFVSA